MYPKVRQGRAWKPRQEKAETFHYYCWGLTSVYPGITLTFLQVAPERQVRLGQTMCTALTEGAQSPGLKAWRLSEIQCSSKKLSSAAVTLATKPYRQLKSKVELLEMAAVLIKQIYSIDINSCFTTIVPM